MIRCLRIMGNWKEDMKALWEEEDGIGVVEIILILVILIMLVVLFREQITAIVNNAFSEINENADTINEDLPGNESEGNDYEW